VIWRKQNKNKTKFFHSFLEVNTKILLEKQQQEGKREFSSARLREVFPAS